MWALEVTDQQAYRPPTQAWVAQVLEGDSAVSWAELEAAALTAAFRAETQNRTQAMEGWLLVARWSRLLGTSQRVITDRWVNAINTAKLGHANMAPVNLAPDEPLSALISSACAIELVSNAEFSESFFNLLTPYDFLPRVLRIIDGIYRADPSTFRRYEQLALAIAVVFDVVPPPDWPHGQVSPRALPRGRPSSGDVFAFWVESDTKRRTLHRLESLEASELKFVVCAAAPLAELRWVQQRLDFDFNALPRAYDAVEYRTDRAEQSVYLWPNSSYTLPVILELGGICIDQGYFASEAGKARGVPTLLFRGAGLDGRHAWFGYLDAQKKWQFDVGRYAEQKLVSGIAFDPQTWGDVNDHELAFLAERFRLLPTFNQSRARQYLAEEQIRLGEFAAAEKSARRAVNFEPRNVQAWEGMIMAQELGGVALVKREATLREAARAFQNYPDLNLRFMRTVIAVMRARGQISAAEHEERLLARQLSTDRSDLAIAQAAELLTRTMAQDDAPTQLRVFENALRQFGVNGGMEAFDRLVSPMFKQTLTEKRWNDAKVILAIARRWLPIEPESQFEREMQLLDHQLERAAR